MHREDCSFPAPETVSLPDLSLFFSKPFPAHERFRHRTGGDLTRATLHAWPNFTRFFEEFPVRRRRYEFQSIPGRDLKWSEARKIALARDCFCCQRCGSRERGMLTVHHIYPRGLGGGNEPGNLVTLCETCHQRLCRHCSRPEDLRVPLGESSLAAQATRDAAESRERVNRPVSAQTA